MNPFDRTEWRKKLAGFTVTLSLPAVALAQDVPVSGPDRPALDPVDVYRFACGEVVTSSGGLEAQLRRPHDFLVVSDHAEYLGIALMIRNADAARVKEVLGVSAML